MNKKLTNPRREKLGIFFLFTGLLIGIFAPNFADPFNVPKQIVLYLFASYLVFDLIKSRSYLIRIIPKILLVILMLLLLGFIVSTFATNVKYIALFGDNLRKNGLFTYLSFLVIFLYQVIKFNTDNINIYYRYFFIINIFVSGYGFLQILNLDFVNWTKSGGIIGTLGNSNFAGVVYAFLGLFSLGAIFDLQKPKEFIFPFFNFIISFICLLNTNARQSYLIFAFGVVILMLNFSRRINKSSRILFGVLFSITTTLVIFGIFNKGPFASFLYKDSIAVRIYYWKAALQMFINHPLFGVGMDRYGSYFKEYRESSYSLRYGFDLTSTNSHNVYLQIFATTGFISGFAYLSLMIYVLFAGIKIIKKSSGKIRNFNVNIFSVWFAFQLQSLVSIDNIGVAIFNWCFSGIIIGSYLKSFGSMPTNFGIKTDNPISILIKPLVMLPAFIVAFYFIQIEQNYLTLRNGFNPSNVQSKPFYVQLSSKTLAMPFLDPLYKTSIANALLDYGEYDLGKKILDQSYKSDARDLSTLWGLALYHEIQGNFSEGIRYRTKIEKLDPWNVKNYLQFLNDYIRLNDRPNAERILKKINDFAGKTEEGKQANSLFTQFYK